MTKNKSMLHLMLIMMILVPYSCLVSCGSSDDEGGNDSGTISGLYYCEVMSGSRSVYYFVNSNTVESYGTITKDANDTWFGEHGQSFPYQSGWYYWPGNKSTMTYYIVDGRIVMTNGTILIISGNSLILDGSNNVYYKWN